MAKLLVVSGPSPSIALSVPFRAGVVSGAVVAACAVFGAGVYASRMMSDPMPRKFAAAGLHASSTTSTEVMTPSEGLGWTSILLLVILWLGRREALPGRLIRARSAPAVPPLDRPVVEPRRRRCFRAGGLYGP